MADSFNAERGKDQRKAEASERCAGEGQSL
jgi:hypothetical protein